MSPFSWNFTKTVNREGCGEEEFLKGSVRVGKLEEKLRKSKNNVLAVSILSFHAIFQRFDSVSTTKHGAYGMGLPFNEQEQEVPHNLKWQNKNILYRGKFRKIHMLRFWASRQKQLDRVDTVEFDSNFNFFRPTFDSGNSRSCNSETELFKVKNGMVTASPIYFEKNLDFNDYYGSFDFSVYQKERDWVEYTKMQAESICTNDIEGLDPDTLIPVRTKISL